MGDMQTYGYGTGRIRGHQFVSRQIHNSFSSVLCPSGLVARAVIKGLVRAVLDGQEPSRSEVPHASSLVEAPFFPGL